MSNPSRAVALSLALWSCSLGSVAVAEPSIRALPLPMGASIEPMSAIDPIRVASDGRIAVTITSSATFSGVMLWSPRGRRIPFDLPTSAREQESRQTTVFGAFASDGVVVGVASSSDDAGMTRTTYTPYVLRAGRVTRLELPRCVDPASLVDVALPRGAYGLNTYPTTSDLADAAPANASLVRGADCRAFGPGRWVTDGFGSTLIGFRYTCLRAEGDGCAEPRDVATIWTDGRAREIGPGTPLAANGIGDLAGVDGRDADVPADGMGVHTRAVAWIAGTRRFLAPGARSSIAWAIDRHRRVLGVVVRAKRHHAFIWDNGRLQLLDDLLRAPRWHLEAAYAFTPNGDIVGEGLYGGVPTMFVLHL